MKIIGKEFNIEDIRYGHESESFAMGYLTKVKNENTDSDDAWKIINAHEDGFECGIKWLCNYLAEFGIQVELHDKVIKATNKDNWYSGEIIDKH